jgi:hypothetical protein
MILFIDYRNPDNVSVEFYNSCPIRHEIYDELTENIAQGIKKKNREVNKYILRTNHQVDDRSCGSFISFYVFCRIYGLSPTQLETASIDMDTIYSFRKSIFANLGEDEKFLWNCEVYSIANDQKDSDDFLGTISQEELESIKYELEELEELEE